MDLNKVPKQFCENITVGVSQESFVMGMLNGETGAFFVLTPQHMKRLSQYLAFQVAEYEKQFGTIKADWQPLVQSPVQTNEIK
ncbi:DUF3467 domain-containing protein [Candidatus Kaiserbacteria bacterium]|nr:DUF3467 domain-containing protein [Candidatus Kaiserbacteria bacterium]